MGTVPDKLRILAGRVKKEAEAKRADRLSNTPKRAKQAAAARIEGDHLERVAAALERLAAAREDGSLPAGLSYLTTKAELLKALRTRIDQPGGYYSIHDTGEYTDQSERAVALRAFLAGGSSQEDRERESRREKERLIAELERKVQFSPIAGFFPTPPDLCRLMVHRARLDKPFLRVLEPSAGKGDLVEALYVDAVGGPTHAVVHCCEINYTLREILAAKGLEVLLDDFLTLPVPADPAMLYDRVVMNPPFENGQDIDQVMHAWGFLKPGGRLVAIMGGGTMFHSGRKQTDFRVWFESKGGECEELEAGVFKNAFRSTGVSACVVTLDRPAPGAWIGRKLMAPQLYVQENQ